HHESRDQPHDAPGHLPTHHHRQRRGTRPPRGRHVDRGRIRHDDARPPMSGRPTPMLISRRDLLRRLGRGAVVSAAFPWVHEAAWAGTSAEPDPIRLDSNENAYGPSERANAAMRESLGVPDRGREAGHALTAEIAALHRVRPEQVVLGCGSVGIMRTAAATFLGPRRKLVLASPTFDPIAEYARSVGADVVTVPLTAQYAHDLDAMLARLDASGGLVYICNPNNPTGTLTPRNELETFIRRLPSTARVLIDEAYHHYP